MLSPTLTSVSFQECESEEYAPFGLENMISLWPIRSCSFSRFLFPVSSVSQHQCVDDSGEGEIRCMSGDANAPVQHVLYIVLKLIYFEKCTKYFARHAASERSSLYSSRGAHTQLQRIQASWSLKNEKSVDYKFKLIS